MRTIQKETSMKSNQVFDAMQSYIGSDIAEIGLSNERPPRSAKFVVSLDMGRGSGTRISRESDVSGNVGPLRME